jgi:hypothetical protein
MRRGLRAAASLVLLTIAACSPPREPRPPATTPPASPEAAVTRRPIETPPPAATTPAQAATATPVTPPVVVPPGVIYVCVTAPGGSLTQTAIEYAPKVDELCRKHPEMGPCQYERNACRSRGGRVFAADGKEITMATEAEYDRKVRRVTFKSN